MGSRQDIDTRFEAWEKYRFAVNPDDRRSLIDRIIEDYSKDVKKAESNLVGKVVLWMLQKVGGDR